MVGDDMYFCSTCGAQMAVEQSIGVPSAGAPLIATPPSYANSQFGAMPPTPPAASPWWPTDPPRPSNTSADDVQLFAAPLPARRTKLVPIVAALAAVGLLAGGGVWLLSGDDSGGGSGGGTQLRGLRSEPQEVASVDIQGSAYPFAVVESTLLASRYDSSSGEEEVVAINITTGDELWSEEGSGTLLGSTVYVLFDGDVQPYTLDGEIAGDSFRLRGNYLFNAGPYLATGSDDSNMSIVNPATEEKLTDLGMVSSNLAFGLEADFDNNGGAEFQVIRIPSGDNVGSGFDATFIDWALLDNGTVVLLDDGDIVLYDENGDELATEDAGDSWEIQVRGNYVFVIEENSATVFDAGGRTLVKFEDDIALPSQSLRTGDSTNGLLAFADDYERQEVSVYRVAGRTITDVMEADGELLRVATDVIYVRDGRRISGWSTSGGTEPLWTLSISDESYVNVVDKAILEAEQNFDADETTVVVYR